LIFPQFFSSLPNKYYSGHCTTTEIQGDHRTPGKRDQETEMGAADFWYSWRKMEAAAQDRAGWRQVVCGVCSTGSIKA